MIDFFHNLWSNKSINNKSIQQNAKPFFKGHHLQKIMRLLNSILHFLTHIQNHWYFVIRLLFLKSLIKYPQYPQIFKQAETKLLFQISLNFYDIFESYSYEIHHNVLKFILFPIHLNLKIIPLIFSPIH